MRLLKKKPRESNIMKIVISKCCGNLKSQTVGKEEKLVLKCKQMWEIESAKQSRCSTLQEKMEEKKVFQKVKN